MSTIYGNPPILEFIKHKKELDRNMSWITRLLWWWGITVMDYKEITIKEYKDRL